MSSYSNPNGMDVEEFMADPDLADCPFGSPLLTCPTPSRRDRESTVSMVSLVSQVSMQTHASVQSHVQVSLRLKTGTWLDPSAPPRALRSFASPLRPLLASSPTVAGDAAARTLTLSQHCLPLPRHARLFRPCHICRALSTPQPQPQPQP